MENERIITPDKDGIYKVNEEETRRYHSNKFPISILIKEILEARNQPSERRPVRGLTSKITAHPSKIKGVVGMSGLDTNIAITLEDDLELNILEKIIKLDKRFYMKMENILGDSFYQFKRKGTLITLGIPIVVLDKLEEGNDYLEIRKNPFGTIFGIFTFANYLRQKYGSLTFK